MISLSVYLPNCQFILLILLSCLHFEDDFRAKLSKILYDPNFSVEMRDEYIQTTAPMWLQHFEKLTPNFQLEVCLHPRGRGGTGREFILV